jgi:prepilin-type N-terminal cleavage/methylation domain-containing protein
MKKSGFTMMELIFVIVILGILAVVAVPKLMATRTDAKVSALKEEVQTATKEVSAYVTSQGGEVNATALTKMSNTLKQLVDAKKAREDSDTKVSVYGDYDSNGNGITCVTFETNDTDLQVDFNDSANGQICKSVKASLSDANYTLAGQGVKY